MGKPRSDRQILAVLVTAGAALGVGSLAAGVFAGGAVLRGLGFGGFAAMLEGIPVGSAIVVLVLMPLVFVIGVGLLWKGVCERLRRTETPGTLLETRVRRIPGDMQDDWVLESRVAYTVDGAAREATGDHAEVFASEAAARAHLARLSAGTPVRVFYRPGEPGKVHLDAPPSRTGTVLAVGAWITLMGCFALFVTGVGLCG